MNRKYNIAYANYLAADGPGSLQDTLDILLDGFDQELYRECVRGIRNSLRTSASIDDAFIAKARQTIRHWYGNIAQTTRLMRSGIALSAPKRNAVIDPFEAMIRKTTKN